MKPFQIVTKEYNGKVKQEILLFEYKSKSLPNCEIGILNSNVSWFYWTN
jgi:hypothetical protein